ncbi:MAG: DUF2752 domain-containing protein [Bacteroidota bacterium]
MKFKKLLRFFYISGLIAAPIVLLILPADYFDEGQSYCPSVLLLHRHCPGCGITKAIQHLIHFDFQIAWEYNFLSFFILPLGIFFWQKELRRTYRTLRDS